MENYLYYDFNYPKRNGPFLERWVSIGGFEGFYEISDYGRCKSLGRTIKNSNGSINYIKTKILSTKTYNRDWYIGYTFSVEAKLTYVNAHVLVAKHFIENPNSKPNVNHKNGIKADSFVGNLEWVTHKENVQHAYDTNLHKNYQSKIIIDLSTGVYFDSIKDAAFSIGINREKLSQYVNGFKINKTNLEFAYPIEKNKTLKELLNKLLKMVSDEDTLKEINIQLENLKQHRVY